MSTIKLDVEGGFKTFLEEQKKQPGECLVSHYQFDTDYEMVFEAKPIAEVTKIIVIPRGGTALLDGIGNTLNRVGCRLSNMKEEDRPGRVSVVILSDGQENSSREFSSEQIKEMLEHQQNIYSWDISYIGCNQDTLLNGMNIGVASASSLSFNSASSKGIGATFSALNRKVMSYRSYNEHEILRGFSPEERINAEGK